MSAVHYSTDALQKDCRYDFASFGNLSVSLINKWAKLCHRVRSTCIRMYSRSGMQKPIRSSRMRRRRMPIVPELAPECFPIVRKGRGNIADHAEGLPKRWR